MDPATAAGGPGTGPASVAGAEGWLAARWSLLLAAAARVLPHPEDAADAACDAACRVWRAWARFDPARGSRETWAYTVARNAAIDRRRRLRVAPPLLPRGMPFMPASGPWDARDTHRADVEQMACARADDRARLAEVWPLLTAREQRYVVYLARGDTYEAIAHADRTPVGTVKTRVRLMRLRLARLAHLAPPVPAAPHPHA